MASFPTGVLAARFTSSKKGELSFNATFGRKELIVSREASTSGDKHELVLKGTSGQPAEEGPVLFTGKARFIAPGGKY